MSFYYRNIQLIIILLFAFNTALYSQSKYFEKAKNSFNIDSSIVYTELFLNSKEPKIDSAEVVEATCFLANKYMDKSRYAYAEKVLNKIYKSKFIEENEEAKALVEIEYGNLFKYQNNYSKALNYYLKAYEYLKLSDNLSYFVKCNVELAEYHRRIAKLKTAKKYINKALSIVDNIKNIDEALEVRIYNRAAAIENESNNRYGSISYSKKALAISRKIENRYLEAITLNEMGYSYKNLYKPDTSEFFYKQAENIWFEIGAEREAVNAMNNRAMLYCHFDYPKAEIFGLYDSIISVVKSNKVDYPLSNVYQYLHLVHAASADSAKAYRYLTKYHFSIMEEERERNDIAITNISEKYENEKVRGEVKLISNELSEKKSQAIRMYFFIAIVVVMIFIISFLAFRLNKSKNILTDRNNEKDMLLKEIHHRVKNNLQVISSLLELQTQKVSDESTVSLMLEGQNRVKAMSLIHKKLYQNDDLAKINFQEYTEDLCAALYQIYKTDKTNVEHQITTHNICFDIDTAIPLGLIINELVTNSYKYAFKEEKKPILKIQLTDIGEGNYELIIADNGKGLPINFDIKKTRTLGLMLVNQLTTQLFGKITYKNIGGSCFSINFKDTFARKQID